MTEAIREPEVLKQILVEEARARAGAHPSVDQLFDYLGGAQDEEAETRTQDHLVGCLQCTQQLLDLETLSQPDSPRDDGVADLTTEAAWREFKARSGLGQPAVRPAPRFRFAAAAAAVLMVATVGLTVRVVQLQTDLNRVTAAQRNLKILDLGGTVRGGEANLPAIELDPADRFLVMVLYPDTGQRFSEYQLELVDEAGDLIWSGRGLHLTELDTLRVGLSAGSLPPGRYAVRASGIEGDESGPVEEFRFTVRSR